MAVLPLNAVIGKYRIEKLVGSGGMGEVYRATNLQTRTPVAVKALTRFGELNTALARFRNEAVIQYNLHHANVAELYECFEFQGIPCIVMEFVEGSTLDQWIRDSGPMEVSRALEILADICDAVSYMHSRGTIHRDIKSENIRLNAQGKAKLLDFGIAISKHTPALTRAGYSIGTPEKMAPEQHLGARGDARSDVWALGVLLYEMVTGALPFSNANPERLRDDVLALRYIPAAKRRPGLPKGVLKMISTCLQLKPEDRYVSSGVMLREVQQLRRSLEPGNWPATAFGKPAIVAGVLGTVALVLFFVALSSSPPARAPEATVPRDTAEEIHAPEPTPPAPSAPVAERIAAPAHTPEPIAATPRNSPLVPAPRPPAPALAAADQRTIQVTTYDGPADVVDRAGKVLGRTPYPVTGPLQSTYQLILSRPGYEPRTVDVQITPNKNEYTFGLEKRDKD
jgi:serine/threonine protein kinase